MTIPISSTPRLLSSLIIILVIWLSGCQKAPNQVTIGVVNYLTPLEPALEGLQAGLIEQGFTTDLEILYAGVQSQDLEQLQKEVYRLLDLGADLLFTMGTVPTVAARNALEQTGQSVPVVFAPLIDPVGAGLIASLAEPSTGITGVHNANLIDKAMEWLQLIIPQTESVVVYYHLKDTVSVGLIRDLQALPIANTLAIDAIAIETPEQALDHLQQQPPNTTLLVIPTPRLGNQRTIQRLALGMGIPVFGYNAPVEDTVVSYTVDWFDQGRQASYLVSRILAGADSRNVSVESAESRLLINLANARMSQTSIDYRWLALAHEVVR